MGHRSTYWRNAAASAFIFLTVQVSLGRRSTTERYRDPQAREGERVDPGPLGRRAERVRESWVRQGVRANLLAGERSEAAIVDAAAVRGASRSVRLHRRDIDALRQAAVGLFSLQPAAA